MEERKLIEKGEIASYFPNKIWESFELEKNQIDFFGIHTGDVEEDEIGKVKFWQKYVGIFYDEFKSNLNLTFENSKNRWIRGEHWEYLKLKKEYPELNYKYPLIVIRLLSERIKFEKPFIYSDFIRYADHSEFRNRGIGTKVFDSVCDKCKSDGIEYIYLNLRAKMPSTFTNWLRQGEVPKKHLEKISSLFYNKPIEKILPWSDSYLKILKH